MIVEAVDQPEQRVGANRHRQPFGQTCACLAAEREPELALQGRQASRSPRRRLGSIGQRLDKGLLRAIRIETAEPPQMHAQYHRLSLPGKVMQHTLAKAVYSGRHLGTGWTRCRLLVGLGDDGDLFGTRDDMIDHKARRDQRQ